MIQFLTLGTLELRTADGQEASSLLAQPKRIALLAYLCIAQPRGFHRRDKLTGLFWPSSDQERARGSLRKALHTLRQALGADTIVARGNEEIAVDFKQIFCDAALLDSTLKASRLEEALEIYRGDLLPGFFIDDAREFEDWLQSQRTRLRMAAARAALTLSDQCEANGDVEAALTWTRRHLELADTDERGVHKLITLQGKAGDRIGALHAYDKFVQHIADEYQIEPSIDMQSLVERLRSGQDQPGGAKAARPGTERKTEKP
jgi:DNA-binding SARP family transcriptional activator